MEGVYFELVGKPWQENLAKQFESQKVEDADVFYIPWRIHGTNGIFYRLIYHKNQLNVGTWQFFVTFSGWLSDPFKG